MCVALVSVCACVWVGVCVSLREVDIIALF